MTLFVPNLSNSVAGELPLDEVLAPNPRNRFHDQEAKKAVTTTRKIPAMSMSTA
jgi:hypothetical protein